MIITLMWVIVCAISRALEGTWFSVGSTLAAVLGISAIGAMFFAPEYPMSIPANAYLSLLTLITSYSSFLGRIAFNQKTITTYKFTIKSVKIFTIFGITSSLISFFVTMNVIGASISDLISPIKVMRLSQAATYTRYTTGLDFPIYYNIANSLVIAYTITLCLYVISSAKLKLSLLVPVIIFVISNMLITTRAPLTFLLCLAISSYLYFYKITNPSGNFPTLISFRMIKNIIALGAFLSGVFFFFQVLRFGENSTRDAADVWAHLRRWPWGSLPSYSLWYDGHGSFIGGAVPGSYTFMGIYDIIGLSPRTVRTYEDYLFLTDSEPANVYTAFRGLYHDFGNIGTFVFMMVIGFCGGASRNIYGGKYILGAVVYLSCTSFVAYSFIVSFWAYTANVFAVIIMPVLVTAFFDVQVFKKVPGKK